MEETRADFWIEYYRGIKKERCYLRKCSFTKEVLKSKHYKEFIRKLKLNQLEVIYFEENGGFLDNPEMYKTISELAGKHMTFCISKIHEGKPVVAYISNEVNKSENSNIASLNTLAERYGLPIDKFYIDKDNSTTAYENLLNDMKAGAVQQVYLRKNNNESFEPADSRFLEAMKIGHVGAVVITDYHISNELAG